MKLKQFKEEKLTTKQKLSVTIVGSLAFIFLLILIFQSFATYKLTLSETIVDAEVGKFLTEITITFNANGATLNTPTGCSNSGANRICRCTMIGTTPCTITPPTITRANWTIHGWRGTNQTNSSGTAPSTSVSANATWWAITSRTVTLRNLLANGSFESGSNMACPTSWSCDGHIVRNTDLRVHGVASIFRLSDPAGWNHYLIQDVSVVLNRRYCLIMSALIGAVTADTVVQMGLTGVTSGHLNVRPSAVNTWARGGAIFTSQGTGTARVWLNFGPLTTHSYVDAVALIDLTTPFGSGNEPSATECLRIVSWIDNTNTNVTVWNDFRV